MTAHEKFKIGDRVEMTHRNPFQGSRLGTAVGFCRDKNLVKVRRNGERFIEFWDMSFWRKRRTSH